MGLNKAFYEEAELEIAQRRYVNAQTLEKRRSEIAEKFPEYMTLKQRLAQTGSLLGHLFFSDLEPEDADKIREKLKRLETENESLQKGIEELLIKHGYKADYLDDIYTCKLCSDSGVRSGKRCDCFMEIVKRKASNEINKASALSLSRFETFDISLYPESGEQGGGKIKIREMARKNLEFCKSYAEDFHLPQSGVLMRGATGLGKTHLSLAIASEVIDKGYSVVYGSVPDLVRKMENEHFNAKKEEETIELLKSADLLILDDLGAEFMTQFTESLLYDIVNSRTNRGLPIIVNTNFTLAELKEKYGERLSSRLLTYEILSFYGDDIRIKKKFGK